MDNEMLLSIACVFSGKMEQSWGWLKYLEELIRIILTRIVPLVLYNLVLYKHYKYKALLQMVLFLVVLFPIFLQIWCSLFYVITLLPTTAVKPSLGAFLSHKGTIPTLRSLFVFVFVFVLRAFHTIYSELIFKTGNLEARDFEWHTQVHTVDFC